MVDRRPQLRRCRLHAAGHDPKGSLKRFDKSASLHDRTLYSTKLVLNHPEASKLMITAAMAGRELAREHPLYKLVSNALEELEAIQISRVEQKIHRISLQLVLKLQHNSTNHRQAHPLDRALQGRDAV